MKMLIMATSVVASLAAAAQAQDYSSYHAPLPSHPTPHSVLTGDFAIVPPYGPLPIRIYDTPQTGPYYNVPAYAVIAPY